MPLVIRSPKRNRTTGSFISLNSVALFLVMGAYFTQAQQIRSGPLIGHTTENSVKIWAYQGEGLPMEVLVRPQQVHEEQSTTTATARKAMMLPRAESNGSSLVTITNLQHSTKYAYEVLVEGSRVAEGQFKTAPRRGPIEFQYLLTSCINVQRFKGYPNQPVWDVISGKEPDFAMLAGDTVYLTGQDWDGNGVRYDRVWSRNMDQRDERHFANFVQNVPTYAAWDDHEYGSNNAEREQKGKENSLKAWKDLWANPSYGLSTVTGNFYSYYWGNVQFIVMDNRWYRNRGGRTQFGDAQKQWLFQQLEESVAVFKVIVGGCDIMEAGFGKDVDDIGQFVSSKKIFGVLFNAGDIHRNEFKSAVRPSWPYPIYQFTSSGIARDNWMRPWSMIHINTNAADPEITASFYGANTKADGTTWSNDPNLECSTIPWGTNFYKDSRCTQTIHLSDVTPEGTDIPDWTFGPTVVPSVSPTSIPSAVPSDTPSGHPSSIPSAAPSDEPSMIPSTIPSALPSGMPSNFPSLSPSFAPSTIPSLSPSYSPTSRARNQTMAFLKPLGGEELIAETQTNIAWNSSVEEFDIVYLEYSLDDEESWVNIADGIPNTGSHVWTVPNQNSDRVKIRVLGHSGNYGENDGFLSIRSANSPNGVQGVQGRSYASSSSRKGVLHAITIVSVIGTLFHTL